MGKITERDRAATEQRLLDTVGELILDKGFEAVGVNAVAARSGVSKILIYRYFDSVEGLITAYIRRHDFWINFPQEVPVGEELPIFLKRMFRGQIAQLRTDPTLKRLYRWELSTNNPLVAALREQRERIGMELIRQVADKSGFPREELAVMGSMLTASVTYLIMLEEFCPVYNGIAIAEDSGWEQIARGIDRLIDRVFGTNTATRKSRVFFR